MVSIGKRWYAKESRREELLPERGTSGARGALSKSYIHERCASARSFLRFGLAKFCPPLLWTLMGGPAPGKNCRKKSGRRGKYRSSRYWVTSGGAIFRESESNVTWRGKSEGIDVETVMSNRYFYKRPLRTSKKLFGNRPPRGRRARRVPRNCIKFHKLFRRHDSEV